MNYQSLTTTSEDEFVGQSVALLTEDITNAIENRGECAIGLSGGSTPKAVYTELGKQDEIDWSKVRIFLIDERYIEPTSDDSNQKLVRETLLANADIPEDNLYFPDTSVSMEQCIALYTQNLIELFQSHPADIAVLGMGNDGHTASLFPPVPESAFGELLALHTTTDAFAVHDRISVSPLVLMSIQKQFLLLKGEEKKEVFEEMMASEMDPIRWPLHVSMATDNVMVVFG